MARIRGRAYLTALLTLALALLARLLLDPVLGDHRPFITLLPGVIIATWLGGSAPALVVAALGYLAVTWWFVTPRGSFGPLDGNNLVGAVGFWIITAITITFAAVLRRARSKAEQAEARAAEQAEARRVTLASIGDAVISTDAAGVVTFMNGEAERLTGWPAAEALGRPLPDVFHLVDERSRLPAELPVSAVLATGRVVGLANHSLLIARDGREHPIDDSASPIRNASGEVSGVVMVFHDVSTRRIAEQRLEESEAELSEFFETSAIGLHWMDADGRILRMNRAGLAMLGHGEGVGDMHMRELYADPAVGDAIMADLHAGREITNREVLLRGADGATRAVMLSCNVQRRDGASFRVRCSTFDVTELKRNQSLLREQATLLEGVAHGRDRRALLAQLCRAVSGLAEGPTAAVLLCEDQARTISEVVAPGMNPQFEAALRAHSTEPGDNCIHSILSGAPFTAADIVHEPGVSAEWRATCEAHGVAACHSAPILGRDGRALGAVALVCRVPREPTSWEEKLTANAASIATVLLERDRAQQALERNQERLATEANALGRLHAASRRLWSARTVAEGLEEMLDAVVTLLSADMGNFQMMDPARRCLVMASHRGFNDAYLSLFAEVKGDESSACGRVMRTGERVIIEDVELDEQYRPYLRAARETGYRCVIATPLVGRDGSTLGVLSAHFREPRTFDEQELRRLDLFIRQAVDFVERVAVETRLRDADRRKDEFLATLAHELRNPLAPMRNAIGLLRLSEAPETRNRAMDMMDRQVSHMVRLIDDLMDVGRITRDKLELRKEAVDLAVVLRHVVESALPMLHGARQHLEVSLPERPMPLLADPARLAQVFGNLLTNASKYSPEGKTITLEAACPDQEVSVRVHDDGNGIAPDKLEAVFEMFTQVESAARRSHGGLGIGLTLARRLVMLHGGTLTASSPGRGHGSTFEVRLPLSKGTPAPAAPPSAPRTARVPRKVLVVDDNRDAAMTLAALLSQAGHQAEVAYDGRQAILMAASSPPEVVVLDLGMPGMNGYDVCRRLRAEPWAEGMRIIALTGWGQEADKRKSRAAGFDHHLVKPVSTEELLSAFEEAPMATARGGA